jgi:Rab GDP dissociation inhibitor
MKTVYEKFGLEPGTQDFIGHAMALYLDDEYGVDLYDTDNS